MNHTSTPVRRGPGRPPKAAAVSTDTTEKPGRICIEVSLGADNEPRDVFVGGEHGNVLITRGKPVWVEPWVVEHLRLAVMGVHERDPDNPNKMVTVDRMRFPFTVLSTDERATVHA